MNQTSSRNLSQQVFTKTTGNRILLPKFDAIAVRSSDAVQAYAREGAEHGKRRRLPSPGNLAERSLSDPSRCTGGVLKALLAMHVKIHNLLEGV
ncbi:hypothetical protein RB4114 [Rhodopirellula baltica SH 1]|uniref:Uncharacterized protein n=2 Tax=Rhodopirellula baltica TaxID=265606 RepID=Q7UT46_RHOBA|nr:hypothetical protein RB4114 [Rhodopirellula baltica SH 1]